MSSVTPTPTHRPFHDSIDGEAFGREPFAAVSDACRIGFFGLAMSVCSVKPPNGDSGCGSPTVAALMIAHATIALGTFDLRWNGVEASRPQIDRLRIVDRGRLESRPATCSNAVMMSLTRYLDNFIRSSTRS